MPTKSDLKQAAYLREVRRALKHRGAPRGRAFRDMDFFHAVLLSFRDGVHPDTLALAIIESRKVAS